jgi:hypothetical protein
MKLKQNTWELFTNRGGGDKLEKMCPIKLRSLLIAAPYDACEHLCIIADKLKMDEMFVTAAPQEKLNSCHYTHVLSHLKNF